MGCGISTMDGDDASKGRRRYNGRFRHQRAIVPRPVVDNKKYNYDNFDDDGDDQEAAKKEEGFNKERLKEKKVVLDRKEEEMVVAINNERQGKFEEDKVNNGHKNVTSYEDEENNNFNDKDDFIGPGSPSFREYCNDYDSVDRSSIEDFNDCPESGESTKNSSDEDSTKPDSEKSCHSNKEPEKKERRGRGGFKNAMYKGKARGGRRNLLNFACYNSSTQSYAEGSFNKVVEKTT